MNEVAFKYGLSYWIAATTDPVSYCNILIVRVLSLLDLIHV